MATVWHTRCAFARLFAGKTSQILNNATDLGTKRLAESKSILTLSRDYSNYAHSPLVVKVKEQYEYEVIKKPPEWAYVERLLPFETTPNVSPKDNYPSGWIPPKEEAKNLPYFVSRNKCHDLPLHLNLTFRGERKISKLKNIDGDIWLMNDDIKAYLKKKYNKYIETRVHELGRFIEVKGDYITDLQEWAHSKGF